MPLYKKEVVLNLRSLLSVCQKMGSPLRSRLDPKKPVPQILTLYRKESKMAAILVGFGVVGLDLEWCCELILTHDVILIRPLNNRQAYLFRYTFVQWINVGAKKDLKPQLIPLRGDGCCELILTHDIRHT